jgi:beta-glucosidase
MDENKFNDYLRKSCLIWLTALFLLLLSTTLPVMAAFTYPFQDPDEPLDIRVADLLSRLSVAEKISLLHQWQPAILRLGIGPFRTGTEALHGVAWLDTATVFPQAIGLGTTWNRELVEKVGSAVADEVRVLHQSDPAAIGLSV